MRQAFCFLISTLLALSLTGCSLLPIEGPVDTDTASQTVQSSQSVRPSDDETSDKPSDSDSDVNSSDKTEPNDILKTPLAQLTAEEQEQLANYLFEKYIPCSYGIFSDAKTLSSASVWSSVEALNRAVDGDESEESRKLENVLKKVAIYYPDTAFDPAKVRVYDPSTKTFAPSPADTWEYVLLSYAVTEDEITIVYENKPDINDPDGNTQQYATTLKNSATAGYFTFVSTVKTGAVG